MNNYNSDPFDIWWEEEHTQFEDDMDEVLEDDYTSSDDSIFA